MPLRGAVSSCPQIPFNPYAVAWALTYRGRTPTDRAKRTAPARDAKFLAQAGGDAQRSEHLRKAYFAALALKSAQSRRRIKELTVQADRADAKLAQLGGAA